MKTKIELTNDLDTGCVSSDARMVSNALSNGADPQPYASYYIHTVVSRRDIDILKLLIDHGVDINHNDGVAITTAIECGFADIVKWLIDNGADIRLGDIPTYVRASSKGYINIFKELIKKQKPKPAVITRCLEQTVRHDHYNLTKYILDEIGFSECVNISLIMLAKTYRAKGISKLLLQRLTV